MGSYANAYTHTHSLEGCSRTYICVDVCFGVQHTDPARAVRIMCALHYTHAYTLDGAMICFNWNRVSFVRVCVCVYAFSYGTVLAQRQRYTHTHVVVEF